MQRRERERAQVSLLRPKASEVLQAQIAAYIAESPRPQSEQDAMYEHVTALAAETNRDSLLVDSEEYKAYVDFLRHKQGMRNKAIAKRAELLDNFATFTTGISSLKLDLSIDNLGDHPTYMGSGMDSDAYMLHRPDGDFAVRLPRKSDIAVRVVDGHLAAAANIADAPRFERVVAASYESGVTVSEVMTGTEITALDLPTVRAITQEQVNDFVSLFEAADRQGVITDIAESNIFYDPTEGFGLIDVHSIDVKNGFLEYAPLADVLGFLSDTLSDVGMDDSLELHAITDERQAAEAIEKLSANFEVLSKFYDAVGRILTGEQRQETCLIIESFMGEVIERIEQYSDTEYVRRCIAENRENADAQDKQLV